MFEQRAKIVLTRRWPQQIERRMAQLGELVVNTTDTPMRPEALRAALLEADVVCPTVTDFMPRELFSDLQPRAKLLANFGVGFNHIDIKAAAAAGIQVTNTPGVLTDATAELALTLMMMSARRTGMGERQVRRDQWLGWSPTHLLGTQVSGKKLGIIGMGRIGTALAHKARHGLGMQIIYNSPSSLDEDAARRLSAQALPLSSLLEQADFVSLHCPAKAETRHLIDHKAFEKMRPHAHLINTARGDIVDEVALVQALKLGQIAGAGLDVYAAEPQLTAGLMELEQVVLLPHMGSATVETRHAMGLRAMENVQALLAQRPLLDPVVKL